MKENIEIFHRLIRKIGAEDVSYLARPSLLFMYRGKIFWFKIASGRRPYKQRTFWFFLGNKWPKARRVADFLFLVLKDINKALVLPMPLAGKRSMLAITDYDGITPFDEFAIQLDKNLLSDKLSFLIQKYDYKKDN